MATQAPGGLDFEAPRRAIEERDSGLHTVNKSTTPSPPHVLEGRDEIPDYLRDVFSREMTHHLDNEVVGEGCDSFFEACEYPDGTHVLVASTFEVWDGKIARQVNVEARDE